MLIVIIIKKKETFTIFNYSLTLENVVNEMV